MAATEDRETLGRARLSFAKEADIDEFVNVLARFERGEIGPDEWRGFRLVRGTYGQRQTGDAQMLRVKIPQGILDVAQLDAMAEVAERYSRGFGHITTRQNIQLHFLKLHDVELVMRRLADVGLTTREACGNSVRNITACPYAGVAADEPFDVTPYAEALTRYLLRHPLSASLPRKFKIAFEGCTHDHISAAINDIGWTARVQTVDGVPVRGFRVTVAGGTATLTRSGHELFAFAPVDEMFNIAEAIVRVFHRLGDYKHKQRNRLKFLVRSLGWDGFKAEFDKELEAFRTEGGAALPFDPQHPPVEDAPESRAAAPGPDAITAAVTSGKVTGPGIVPRVEPVIPGEEFEYWRRTNVRGQKQAGFAMVTVTTVLGDLTSAQMRMLGQLALAYSDGTVRITSDQNVVLRWVPESALRPAVQPAGGRRTVASRRLDARGRHQLSRRGVVQAGGHAVARARPAAVRRSPRTARSRQRVAGPRHQDQRLPQRVRPASHRRHRIPGQPAQGRRPPGPALLRHGGWRDLGGGHHLRSPRRHGAGASIVRGARAPGAVVSRRGRFGVAADVLPAGRGAQGEGGARRPRETVAGRRVRDRLHRSG